MATPAITTTVPLDQSLLDPPEALFSSTGDMVLNTGADNSAMEVDNPTADTDDVLDYGDDEEKDNGAGSSGEQESSKLEGLSNDGEGERGFLIEPMRGGGIHRRGNPKTRIMALEGADKDEEDKLRARFDSRKWYLNENLMVPMCRGHCFDSEQDYTQKEFEALDCERCQDYTAHVATEFGSGEGSLKAVLQLRKLYMLADERIEVAQLRMDNQRLEAANEMADLLDTKVNKELDDVRKEKSLLDQQIGQLKEQLDDAHDRRRNAEDEADDLKDANDSLRDKIRHLSALLDETDYGRAGTDHKRPRYTPEASATPAEREADADHEMGEIPGTTTHAGMPAIPYSAQVMAKYAADTVASATMMAESSKAAEAATQPLSARLSAPKADIRRDHVARNTNPSMSRPNHHFTRTPGVQFANCVVPPPPGLMDEVDAKGFPADVETWNTHWRLVKTGQPYWVLAHRCFFIYAFARDIPAEDRTIVQQLALEEFYMMDWYCDMLRKLAGVKDATNAEKHRLMSLKRDDLPYDPKTRALLMQLREVHDVAGCGFVDKCWTLDMRLVRGLALLEALSLGNRGDKTEPYRSIRVRLEKLFIELFATPRLYRTRLHERRLTPATFFTPMHWDPLTAANATMDTVVSSFAHMGVSEAMVDDAFKFGQKWLHDWTYRPVAPPGWTADEVSDLISATAGGKEPAGFFRKEDDLFPRPPTLAWASSADNVIAFQLSHLQHSELSGMRRQPNSVFQKQLDAGLKLYPHENRNVLRLANPFLAENKARVQQSRNTTTAPSGPSTYISGKRRGKARVNPRPVAPGPTQLGQGIHPSMIMPDSFTTTQPIVFFDPNTTAANSALSFQSSNLEFSPFGSAYFNSPDNEI
ncbi:hypothetical protein B0H17DRAFT_1206478 [Mycena rosella]|uniref:Uncharacterized protein n=1 Tax=Mycena rosella TaxID=1033263 RepID=A0AAD7D516_MYCRO|nr:hypothetical protein B0H17DRAFT_1206478 [Mycena rosella]